ncbi:MAG: hypothetical protein RIC55_00200 [Pirellulaceae bacterium]
MKRNLLICAAFVVGSIVAGYIQPSGPPAEKSAAVSHGESVVQVAEKQVERQPR